MTTEQTAAPQENTLAAAVEQNIEQQAEVIADTQEAIETEQAEATDQEQVEEAENTEEPVKVKKNGLEKRFAKLSAKIQANEDEIAFWKQEALKSNRAQPQEQQNNQTMAKPKFEDFSNLEEYTEAQVDYKLYQRDLAEQQRQQKQKQESVLNGYNARVAEFIKSTPDYHEALDEADDMVLAAELTQVIVDSELGPQIAYYLSKNIDEIDRLNALTPMRRLVEMGKIEDRLAAKTQPQAKQKAPAKPAPPPVKPVSGPAAVGTKSIYEMTPQELIESRNKIRR